MPREYNLIQAPEMLRRLRRFVGIRQQSQAPTLAENVVPVIVVQDLSRQPDVQENRKWAFGSTRATGPGFGTGIETHHVIAMGGAQTFIARLKRATITIEPAAVPNTTRTFFNSGHNFVDPAYVAYDVTGNRHYMHPRDREVGSGVATRATVGAVQQSIGFGPTGRFVLKNDQAIPYVYDLSEVTVGPGQVFVIQHGNDEVATTVMWEWEEIPLPGT